mmetsp:Transcript_65474/g.188687  ORF Transcript_65474/g.188687 Transcript_65474/m.188687 type:complete len:285 (-) Transcript_65474:1695-2549(-)
MPGPAGPVNPFAVMERVQQMNRVIDGQAHDRDEEDALVLTETPSHDGDKPQEDDRDADDIGQAQQRDPPIPSGQHENQEGDDQGQQHSHDCSLHHLVLGHHELVQVSRLETADGRSIREAEVLPPLEPSVGLLHGVPRRVRRVEADPDELQLFLVRGKPEACQPFIEQNLVLPSIGRQGVVPRLRVRGELIAAKMGDELGRRQARVVGSRLRRVAHGELAVPCARTGAVRLRCEALARCAFEMERPIRSEVLHETIAPVLAPDVVRHVHAGTPRGLRLLSTPPG